MINPEGLPEPTTKPVIMDSMTTRTARRTDGVRCRPGAWISLWAAALVSCFAAVAVCSLRGPEATTAWL